MKMPTINEVESRIRNTILADGKMNTERLTRQIKTLKQYGISAIETRYLYELIKPKMPTLENQFSIKQRCKMDFRDVNRILKQRRKVYSRNLKTDKNYANKRHTIKRVLDRNFKKSVSGFRSFVYTL